MTVIIHVTYMIVTFLGSLRHFLDPHYTLCVLSMIVKLP